ncbi:MAG: hypothetical protein EOO06_01010 [Chitinophagaceae bacterium]|nr:MAG: hypothetical protein EOO06_01010 [Chitinophagaceae bacterium]
MADYIVTVIAQSQILVTGVGSEEVAMEIAFENAQLQNFNIEETDSCKEIVGLVELDRAKRHADQIIN